MPMPSSNLTVRRCVAFTFAAFMGYSPADLPIRQVAPNDNRVAGGLLRDGTLMLRLEAREGVWRRDGPEGPGLTVAVFTEMGHQPQNPGPLIRVPAGTRVRVSVRNALCDSTLIMYGLHARPGALDDTIQIAAGATRLVSFDAGTSGTYFYWATTTHHAVADRDGYDSQLHGAFIIDRADRAPAADRIFVLAEWIGAGNPATRPELRVINGLSWPHTEPLSHTVGDTVRWRWLNPSSGPHPMHLHGFYFDVTSRGTYAADTSLTIGATACRDRDAAVWWHLHDAVGSGRAWPVALPLSCGVSHVDVPVASICC